MPRAVIITTHEVDYQAVTTHLGNLEEEVHPQGTIYNLGQFDVKDSAAWEVAICEVSEQNADVAAETERAISHFKPDVIFLIGAATGIKDVMVGDIVVATKIYSYESGKVENEFLTRPEVKNSSYNLQQRAKSERKKDDWMKRVSTDPLSLHPSIFIGSIASGDKEITDDRSPLLDFLQSNYNDAVAIDRVGHGFLNAVHANQNISALTIHGITYCIDRPEPNSRESRSIALQNASAFAFEVLAKFTIATITERQDGIIIRNITPESLYANIQEAVKIDPQNLVDERHRRIDEGRTLLNLGQFDRALEYLEGLQSEIWHSSDNSHRYRIITNLGGAKLGLGKVLDGAAKLIEALQYSPDDEMALARAAQGYFLQNDITNTKIYIQRALEKNPANQLARSLQVYMASPEESIESILESIPSAYHQAMDVLIALGEASLNRGLRDRAIGYLQAALDIDNSSNNRNGVKVCLGFTLMEPIAEQYSTISLGQIREEQKSNLERAIALFDEVLGEKYLNPKELVGVKFEALINRAGSLRLLERWDESIRDFDTILAKDPDNPHWIKQRALLAYKQGKEAEAVHYLTKILSAPETPEASLLAADSLMVLDRLDEAIDILDRFLQNLQSDSPVDLQREARRLKFEIFLKRNEHQNAEIILNQAIDEDSENFHAIVIQLQWYKYIGEEDKILPLIDRAKAAINPNTPIVHKALIAYTLYSLEYYRDVVEVYEQFVDSSLNTEVSRRLLLAYYRSGNYGKALDLCRKLLERYEPQLPTSEIAAYIYREIIGDLDSARQICNAYLAKFPEDWKMRLVLAIINYETCEYDRLDLFLDSYPSIQNIISLEKHTDSYCQLALLYKVRGRINSFLEIIYEIRHHYSFKIIAITDKYFAAAKLSHPLLETQTNVEDFRMFTISMDGDRISEQWIQDFIASTQQRQDYFSNIKSLYTSGKVPIGTVAKMIHCNLIETWGYLSSGSTPCIHAWSNFEHEKFENAVITLKKGGLVVIDPISLFTIHSLGIADDVVSNIGKLGIAQSTLNLLQGLIEQTKGWEAQGFSTFGAEDGYSVMQEVPPEVVNAERSKLEQILNWIRDNCFVLPCNKALEIDRNKREELNQVFDSVMLDTMLIACEPGRILYSDDQWLRWYARVEFGVQGVWTQVVLNYCLLEKSVNETLYRRATLGLAQRGYSYTKIDAKTLLEAVKLSDWQVRPIYTAALTAIANPDTTFESALSVTVDFLYQLYLELNIEIIDPRDAIVHELLKVLPKSYGVRVFIQNLKHLIVDKFRLIPLQAKKVIEAIDSWLILTIY